MLPIKLRRGALVCLLALCCMLMSAGVAMAEGEPQSPSTSAGKDVDLEVKLYLVVASNVAGEAAKPPAQLDGALRQLSSSLPFNHFRWAGTFINRVNNGSNGSTKGIAGPLLGTTSPSSGTPSFYDLELGNVSLITGATGQELIRLNLHFGARLPVTVGGSGPNSAPQISYEGTGVTTTVSLREGEPVVAGTMGLGATNDLLLLVIVARRMP